MFNRYPRTSACTEGGPDTDIWGKHGGGEGHRGTNKRGGMGGGVRSQDGVTGKKEWGSQSQPIRCKRVGNKVGRYTDGHTEERKIDRLMCRQKEGKMQSRGSNVKSKEKRKKERRKERKKEQKKKGRKNE